METRKILTREKNSQDKLDAILTNPIGGILIFVVVMFLVFNISQSQLGPYLADILTGWIESFQGFVADKLSGASPFMQALVADGIVGGVGAVVGFLPLVMVFPDGALGGLRLHGACIHGSGPHLQKGWSVR